MPITRGDKKKQGLEIKLVDSFNSVLSSTALPGQTSPFVRSTGVAHSPPPNLDILPEDTLVSSRQESTNKNEEGTSGDSPSQLKAEQPEGQTVLSKELHETPTPSPRSVGQISHRTLTLVYKQPETRNTPIHLTVNFQPWVWKCSCLFSKLRKNGDCQ